MTPLFKALMVSSCLLKWNESCLVVSDSLRPHGLYSPWNSLGQNTAVGNCSLLQGIFLTQGLNPGLPHCRWILYQLSNKGRPRTLEWVAYPFSSRSSQPRNWTGVSCIAGRFFLPTELSGLLMDNPNLLMQGCDPVLLISLAFASCAQGLQTCEAHPLGPGLGWSLTCFLLTSPAKPSWFSWEAFDSHCLLLLWNWQGRHSVTL